MIRVGLVQLSFRLRGCECRAVPGVIIAETGADMTRFRTAGHLASWAGICPEHHESAGNVGPASD
jgi:hypothetical protein